MRTSYATCVPSITCSAAFSAGITLGLIAAEVLDREPVPSTENELRDARMLEESVQPLVELGHRVISPRFGGGGPAAIALDVRGRNACRTGHLRGFGEAAEGRPGHGASQASESPPPP